VFEEVRETGVAREFVLAADVVPDLEIDHRHFVVFEQNDLQAV